MDTNTIESSPELSEEEQIMVHLCVRLCHLEKLLNKASSTCGSNLYII